MHSILIVDDDRDIREAVKIYMASEFKDIYLAENGVEALEIVREKQPEVVILDIMMPVMDGFECAEKIREFSNVPIIFLSAKDQDADKIAGLNIGADDYLTKPFNPFELLARVKSILRRYTDLGAQPKAPEEVYICGNLLLDSKKEMVSRDGEWVNLTPTEYKIFEFLMLNPNQVHSSKDIYSAVWQSKPFGAEGTLAVHIRHLREKLEINPAEPRYITVVWGQGYRLYNEDALSQAKTEDKESE
ncbi:MAG: response regulator transcription factor [Eubacteriales bacterium]|nr:response regulator transcription factor [Eubacteriales bacterium]